MQRLTLPASLLLPALLLVHVVLWWMPVERSLRFCDYVEELYIEDNSMDAREDRGYAHQLRNGYLAAATVSLAYAVAGCLYRRLLLFVLCAVQWLLPLWLIRREPEEVIVHIRSGAGLIVIACAGGFALCLAIILAAMRHQPLRR